jgi:hypothetical protein
MRLNGSVDLVANGAIAASAMIKVSGNWPVY